MNKVTSYLKNVGKSISYATVDVVGKTLVPEVSEFTSTNKDLFKAVYATVTHSKQSMKYGKKLAKDTQIYKDINKGINNALEDIKTGNFYNKDRAKAAEDAAADAMMGGNFDFGDLDDFSFDDWDADDGSLDDFQDKAPPVNKGDIVIADTVTKSSNLSAQLISKTVANTSSNIINANMATTNMVMAQNVELVAGIRTSIAGVHESINSILKFTQTSIPTMANNQSQYFTDSMAVMKENNAILKEMLEMQRNVYKDQLESSKSKDQFSDVFMGGLDLTEYFKAIKKNIKGLDKTGMISMITADIGGSSMLGQFMANPLGEIMTGLVGRMMPLNLSKQIASFSKTLGNMFPTMIAKLNKWKKDDFGILGLLGTVFGLQIEDKKSIDTSKYNKGAVPFDGITRKAIVDVIPEHLSRIESILSNKGQRLYDYHTGKWISSSQVKQKKQEIYERRVKDSFGELSDDIKTFIKSLEEQKVLDAERKKSFEDDIFKMMSKTFDDGGYFSPSDIKKNASKYGFTNPKMMEALLETLAKAPVSKLSSVSAEVFDNARRYGQTMRDYETKGDSIFRKLYDGSYVIDAETINKIAKESIDKKSSVTSSASSSKSTISDAQLLKALSKAQSDTEGRSRFSDLDEDKFEKMGSIYKNHDKWTEEMENIPGDTFLQKFQNANTFRQKYALMLGSLGDIAKKPATLLTGMIASAERSIYNFLFESETDQYDSTGKKIKGFFSATIEKMKDTWGNLTTRLDEQFITPLVKKYGLDEKWEEIKAKAKNSKPGQFIKKSARSVSNALKTDLKSIFKFNKKVDIDSLLKMVEGKNEAEIAEIKATLTKEEVDALERLGFAEGGEGIVRKGGLIAVSAGEKINVKRPSHKYSTIESDKDGEFGNIIQYLKNMAKGKMDDSAFATVERVKQGAKKAANSSFVSDTVSELINGTKTFFGRLFGLGNTEKEQDENIKKEQSSLRKTIGSVIGDMKGQGASTASKAIIGGGVGLLSGVLGGPLIGAGLGAAYSLIKNSETVQNILFGEEITEGEDAGKRKGGLVSQKVQNIFTDYLPDMGKGAVLGTIGSFITPLGPLGGAVIGSGIGLLKNSKTFQEMIFGEEGLLNEQRQEKIKKVLPKTAAGAVAGMFLGPFGILGNAALGTGIGLLSGTTEFKDFIFGEEDQEGNREGGLVGSLNEHFVEPLKDFGRNFKEDFFGFVKESMIDPLNDAITPIANEIAFQTKRVVFGIPKWFLNLGKDYIAMPIINKLEDTVIGPIAKATKSLFGGILGKFKGLISLPFRAIGGLGNMTRKHQIKQGRDVVGLAKDRLKFADSKKMGSYKYGAFDSALAERSEAGDVEWLEELTARTGMLAHGADYFDKEVKKARNELSKVVGDYYKLGWFAKDKKSYKRIRQYIHDNDIESAIEELINIKESRVTGGPLDSEASNAIARLNKANKKYQVARDNKQQFGDINETDNAAWMEEQFGSDWRSMKSDRLFEYARKESMAAGGKKVEKGDLFKDPTQIITKGEEKINSTLNKILMVLSHDKNTFLDEDKESEYNTKAQAGMTSASVIISNRKSEIKDKLSKSNIKASDNIVSLLYTNPNIYDLVLSASSNGITYDDSTIETLCGMKLSKKEVDLLKRFPHVATLPENQIEKNLNHLRNNHATVFSNRLFGAKKIRNNNLGILNLASRLNGELDESILKHGSEVNKDDDKGMYQNTNYGLRRYIKDQKGKWTLDLSDTDTKESLQKEKDEEAKKNSFFSSFSGIKDGVLGLFNRNKEKDEEEKKEPWYKRLFNVDLSSIGGKAKFGVLLLGGLTAIGALTKFFTENKYGQAIYANVKSAVEPVVTKIGNWFTNQGEYAPDQGITKFLDKHVFPNLFAGMNVFFGKVMPALVSAFVDNLPDIITAGVKSALRIVGIGRSKKDETSGNLNPYKATAGGVSVSNSTSTTSASWLSNLEADANATATNINNIKVYSGKHTKPSERKDYIENNRANGLIEEVSAANNTSTIPTTTGTANPDDPVEIEGTYIYKKNKKGKLVSIKAKEFESGEIKEFWNEDGSGHWVYDEQSGQFITAEDSKTGTSTKAELFKRIGYGASRAFLTGTTPLGLNAISKGFSKISKGVGRFGLIGKSASFITKLSGSFATGYDKLMKGAAYSGKSFRGAYRAADAANQFSNKRMASGKTINVSKIANATVDGSTNVGNKVKKASAKHNSKILNTVIDFAKKGISKILNNSTVGKKVAEALAESGSKKPVTEVIKEIIDKISKTIAKNLAKVDSKIISKIASKAAQKVFFWVFIITDFTTGIDQAEAILKIKKPNILQTLIAGLANVISNLLFFGFIKASKIVEWIVDYIFPIFDIDTTKYKEQQQEAEDAAYQYNKQYGDNLSTEEYLKRTESFSGGIFKSTKAKNTKNKTNRRNAGENTGRRKYNSPLLDDANTNNATILNKQSSYYENLNTNIEKANKINDLKLGKQYGFTKNGKYIGLEEGIKRFNKNDLNKINSNEYTFNDVLNTNSAGFAYQTAQSAYTTGLTNSAPKSNKPGLLSRIRNWFAGKGTGDESGFVSQVDPKYKNKKFNTSQDTEHQTIGDSGCAPATAANVINLYAGMGNEFRNATKAALRYKDRNGGVNANYFQDYLGGRGIATRPTMNKKEMMKGIVSGSPTILLGQGTRGNTPYGKSPHYVLATGLDGRGNVVIQDPESRKPNSLYPVKDVLKNSHLGMLTGRASLFSTLSKEIRGYYDEGLLNLFGFNKDEESMYDNATTYNNTSNNNISNIQVSGSAADVVRIAQSQIGYKAGPNKASKYDDDIPRDTSGWGWCGYFVRWCYVKAGVGHLFCGGGDSGNPKKIHNYYKSHKQQVGKYEGQPGDIIVIYPDAHHVGIIEKNNGDGSYTCIEGNTGGGNGEVQRRVRKKNLVYSISRPFMAGSGTNSDYKPISIKPLSGRGTFQNATNAALSYKDKNTGVTPDYFEDYLGKNGIATHSTTDKKELISNIQAGRPTILLGQNSNMNANTPYGTSSSHYVLATGVDGKGNVIVQDPESRRPNSVYPANDLINNSQLGMVTSRSSGYGTRKFGGKFSQIRHKLNSKIIAGRGLSKTQIEKKVWAALRAAGYNEIQTAAVMGNIKHESGFRPSAIEKSGGGGFGLCQWTGRPGRRAQLEKYAKSVGKSASNLDVQITFLLAEMNPKGGANGYASYNFNASSKSYDGKSYTKKIFNTTNNIETATRAFCFCFERPSEDPNVNHISSRIKSAKSYYKTYTGLDPASVSISSDDSSSTDTSTTSTSNNIFSAISNAALSYFDEGLLSLFGFNETDTSATEDADSTIDEDFVPTTNGKFAWPTPKLTTITSKYGMRYHPISGKYKKHTGVDISGGNASGAKIIAVADGKVISVIKSSSGYGNHLIIDHGNKIYTLYAHCSSISAKKGDIVKQGHTIAKVGSTGASTGPHLHFEVRKGSSAYGKDVDPMNYISKPSGKGSGYNKIHLTNNKLVTSRLSGKGKSLAAASTSPTRETMMSFLTKKTEKYFNPESGTTLVKKGNDYYDPITNTKVGSVKEIVKQASASGKGTSYIKNNRISIPIDRPITRLSGTGSLPKLPSINNSNYRTSNGTNYTNTTTIYDNNNSSTDKLLSVIIDVLSIIANNSEKLSQIVELLSKALDLNLTDNEISKLSSNNAQIKNKLANALKSQGSTTGMGNSIMNASTESLATAMYSIASA